MDTYTVALFGEAEKGQFQTAYHCRTLPQLVECFGHPPPDSVGLHFAVQALLYERDLIFFRVREEGFSLHDYFHGIELLTNQNLITNLAAIGVPGVGDKRLLDAFDDLCERFHSFIITSERDLYDILTGDN
ncbi:MAG: hypothetical protein H7A37_06805 [Chlamydiales bacterium]|nr:hypothetical protein [Chlamydiia bacterium]MCP5507991.1 hypothetical protein [Chlamydiales bacterium]